MNSSNVFSESLSRLRSLSLAHSGIVVSFSGGKDSLCVLDLCCKTFQKVVCFHMYFVDGLDCVEKQLQYAKDRYGVTILKYPHWVYVRAIQDGVYCVRNHVFAASLPEFKLRDIYDLAKVDSGYDLIAMGGKSSDSLWRRRNLSKVGSYNDVAYPLKEWNKFDVLSYLKINNIPTPDSSGANANGIDLSSRSLLWLHDEHPGDFKKIEAVFPFVRAVVKRREFHGIE